MDNTIYTATASEIMKMFNISKQNMNYLIHGTIIKKKNMKYFYNPKLYEFQHYIYIHGKRYFNIEKVRQTLNS